jgi:hypothetical protein
MNFQDTSFGYHPSSHFLIPSNKYGKPGATNFCDGKDISSVYCSVLKTCALIFCVP